MKIKRFKNIWTMGVILCIGVLLFLYLLKIIFPSFVIEVAHVDGIVNIGKYIDTHKWLWFIVSFILSFLAWYLYCCACKHKYYLSKKELIILIGTILVLFAVQEFLPKQYTSLNISALILLPMIFKADFKTTAICFTVTNIVQTITLEIRDIGMMIVDFNFATLLILMLDYYIVELLLYLLFNKERSE